MSVIVQWWCLWFCLFWVLTRIDEIVARYFSISSIYSGMSVSGCIWWWPQRWWRSVSLERSCFFYLKTIMLDWAVAVMDKDLQKLAFLHMYQWLDWPLSSYLTSSRKMGQLVSYTASSHHQHYVCLCVDPFISQQSLIPQKVQYDFLGIIHQQNLILSKNTRHNISSFNGWSHSMTKCGQRFNYEVIIPYKWIMGDLCFLQILVERLFNTTDIVNFHRSRVNTTTSSNMSKVQFWNIRHRKTLVSLQRK